MRYVWQYVESLDLSPLYQNIKAAGSKAGRNPIDPQILFSLWLDHHRGNQLCSVARRSMHSQLSLHLVLGGVSVNYHTLDDFRAQNGDLLEQRMIDSIAVLLQHDLITLAQHGIHVRASAGTDSFRRQAALQRAAQEKARQMNLFTPSPWSAH